MAKVYDRNNALVAADLLNDRVLTFFEEQHVQLLRLLTDRGIGYCGNRDRHEYELYPGVEDIDRSKTRARNPKSKGICERFFKTVQNEFHAVAFRKKLYDSLEELQRDLDAWMADYNTARPHTGKYCYGKTPMQTFIDAKHLSQEKMLDTLHSPPQPLVAVG